MVPGAEGAPWYVACGGSLCGPFVLEDLQLLSLRRGAPDQQKEKVPFMSGLITFSSSCVVLLAF